MSVVDARPPRWWVDWLISEGVDPATTREGAVFKMPDGILIYTDLFGQEHRHVCQTTPHGDIIKRQDTA